MKFGYSACSAACSLGAGTGSAPGGAATIIDAVRDERHRARHAGRVAGAAPRRPGDVTPSVERSVRVRRPAPRYRRRRARSRAYTITNAVPNAINVPATTVALSDTAIPTTAPIIAATLR